MIPAFCKPIKAINKPIPEIIDVFNDLGIASTMASRILKIVS
jgi:hypothetical protein